MVVWQGIALISVVLVLALSQDNIALGMGLCAVCVCAISPPLIDGVIPSLFRSSLPHHRHRRENL